MLTAIALGWLIPGAGHLFLKKNTTGILILVGIGVLFVAGVLTGQTSSQVDLGIVDWLYWFSRLASGLTFLGGPIFSGIAHSAAASGDSPNINFEYGRISLVIAGLLNYLALLNIFDICQKENFKPIR